MLHILKEKHRKGDMDYRQIQKVDSKYVFCLLLLQRVIGQAESTGNSKGFPYLIGVHDWQNFIEDLVRCKRRQCCGNTLRYTTRSEMQLIYWTVFLADIKIFLQCLRTEIQMTQNVETINTGKYLTTQ